MGHVKPTVWVCLAVLALAGCSSDDERAGEPASTAQPTKAAPATGSEAVAHALSADALARAPADLAAIEARGRPVASTRWDGFVGTVAAYWAEEHGVPLFDPPRRFQRHAKTILDTGVGVLVLDDSHRRRYAARLARLRPSSTELKTYYDEFYEEHVPDAGQAVLDWLRVFRESLARARGNTVVVVGLLD